MNKFFMKLISAKTDDEYKAAKEALYIYNASAPTDREMILEFLKKCKDHNGSPLTLDQQGRVVTLQ